MSWTKSEQAEIEAIKDNVQSLQNAIRGSNDEKGLVSKVDVIDQKLTQHMLSEIVCPIHDVMVALYGDRKEGIEAKGLIAAVAENTKFRKEVQETIHKLEWLLVAAIIGGFGNLVFAVFKFFTER